ncbi:MAG: lysine--tRNA ligase [Clostridiaceae bacterium]|jgi:lysyl-tRNA synthetase class 2|nr:lysine--tRNA ligase [Clostridiaceae bacterium]
MQDPDNSSTRTEDSSLDLKEQYRIRLEKLRELVREGTDPFREIVYPVTHHTSEIIENFESTEGIEVSVAGRIMSRRGMGKVSFCDLYDRSGRIQIFTKIDAVGEDAYERWQKLDIGDIVGVRGEVFRTRMGEISVRTKEYTLLTKALRPLPDKYHGLKDTETRYRQRYVDLIVNPEVRDTFEKRSRIIRGIRNYLDRLDFIEVETPILNSIPGGAAARPFVTHHNTLDMDMYLRIAPELYLKRLIVGGFERVYEIGRLFRNEGMSVKHNPEFTAVELYQAYTDLRGMMTLCEELLSEVALQVNGSTEITYQGTQISLKPPFARISMTDAVLKYAGMDFTKIESDEKAIEAAKSKGLDPAPTARKGEVLNLLFETFCEDKLVQPTFVHDYPIEVSPLAKKIVNKPGLVDRFELFIGCREFANAYSELNDPIDQRDRFADQIRKRAAGDDEANLHDEDFCVSLEYGMPPTGGLGIGVDRLVMLLTDTASIRDVLLFPTMKPLPGDLS